jgi:ribose-phosphate pyrophosphokinase
MPSFRNGSLIADWIAQNEQAPFIIGPDIESEQWVAEVAARAGAPYRVLRKERRGDRDVEITIPDLHEFREHRPVLVDDIVSSGRTMVETARQLGAQGMQAPVCIAVHALLSAEATRSLLEVADRVVSSNSVLHETNGIDLSSLLVEQVSGLLGDQA